MNRLSSRVILNIMQQYWEKIRNAQKEVQFYEVESVPGNTEEARKCYDL